MEEEDNSMQAYMEGLSRLDRVVDDSGYAFTALDVIDKNLVGLEPIRNYQHLLFVNLAKNQIEDVTPLTELPHLVCLNLSENALTTPIVFPQQYLQSVDLSQNQIPTLQGFQSTSLSSLKINGNLLENLTGLAGLPSLVILEASQNDIQDLTSLSNESCRLETLELQENKITALDGIENVQTLTCLRLQRNNIETMEAIDKLRSLTNLTELDLSENPVTEVENYGLLMILLLPNLKKLDGADISDEERLAAVELKQQLEDADAAASSAENDTE